MTGASPDAARRCADPALVEVLVLDADGVLTDGSILMDDDGRETKRFNIRDGFGFRLWAKAGGRAAVITGRAGMALRHRLGELRVAELVQGSDDKGRDVRALSERVGVPLERIAFVGDDWPDLPAMNAVGFPIAVGDAEDAVKRRAALVTAARGGHGAVREAVEHMLRARGVLHGLLAEFDRPARRGGRQG